MSSVLRGSKKKIVTELKVGNIILSAAEKKAKITGIRKVKATADMEGLKGSPIAETFYVVSYEFTDPRWKGDKRERTYRASEYVVWYPEKKRAKFSSLALVTSALAGMLAGMCVMYVLMT